VIFAQSVLYDHCQIPEQWKNNKAGMYWIWSDQVIYAGVTLWSL
jgi:hypothetical protein